MIAMWFCHFGLAALPVSAQMKDGGSILAKDMVGQLSEVSEKWVSLLNAIPEDKLDWHPAEGVRSIRELFTHIGDANYMFATIVGAKLPDRGMMPKDQTKQENRFKTKAEIAKNLKSSFNFSKEFVAGLSDKDMSGELDMFGSKTNGQSAMMTNLGHMHEHLGQAIVYARMNGITPPWSAGM